jgi:hypothetical protein
MANQRSGGQERSFGLGVGTVCVLLAAHALWRGAGTAAWTFGVLAAILLGFALTAPSFLAVPSRLWWRLAQALGWLNSRLLLGAVFVFLMTPIGVLMRAGGWDSLQLKRRARTSGWVPYPARNTMHYERMY